MLNTAALVRGQTHKGTLRPSLGHPVEVPYFVLRGNQEGPNLLVTAGVHGAEYASIEAAYQVAAMKTTELSGTVTILPMVNPPSFFARSIYINPVDQKNLNRQFPGNPTGSFAERLAHWLTEEFITKSDAYLDLHGGDMIEALTPFSIFRQGHDGSRELAEAFGLELVVESNSGIMSCSAGADLGVPSVLAEASGQGRWPKEEVERLRFGVERVMRHLGMLEGENVPVSTKLLTNFAWLSSEHTGLWYPIAVAGERVKQGQHVGQVKTILGEVVQDVTSPIEGVVLFSVSSLAIGASDPLFGIGA